MWCVWAAKGGSGASVVGAALALLSARERPTLLVDFGGDLPAILGADTSRRGPLASESAVGVLDWLAADDPPADALARLEVPVSRGLSLVPCGGSRVDGPSPAERLDVLAAELHADGRPVVVDVGSAVERFGPMIAASATSILVTRACYLALRRPLPSRVPDRIVLVDEPGRALRRSDVAAAVGAPVSATVAWDPIVARAVDAGLLASRLPRPLRSLRPLVGRLHPRPVAAKGAA